MPNWCNTSISFEVHDESQKCMDALKDFYYKIKNQLDSGTSLGENGFGSSWLGNFYILFGIGTYEQLVGTEQGKLCHCRGSFYYIDDPNSEYINGEFIEGEFNSSSFNIATSDAWGPALQLWQLIINKNYSDEFGPLIDIYYQAEEPGCELYYTNDPEGRFYCDQYNMDISVSLIPNVYKFCSQKPGSPFMNVDKEALNRWDASIWEHVGNQNISKIYPKNNNQTAEMHLWGYPTDESDLVDMCNDVLFTEPVKTLEEAKNRANEIIPNQDADGYIGLHDYKFAEIDDLDPVEYPKENKEEK